jgi:undecaprenyl diphosphate synthase
MDGNGRWAQARGKERIFGHASGTESVRACIAAARKTGVKFLTLYAFSTENWGRPIEEVNGLMELLCDSVMRESAELQRQGVRMKVIGSRGRLSDKVRRHIDLIEDETAGGGELTVVLAVNYSSRSEIARAASLIASEALSGQLSPVMITESTLEERLFTADIPDPDLVIRTGGEQRLSNFLLWQAAYAELYFTPVLWPDFGEEQFVDALAEYSHRERRFGKINNKN